MGIRSFFGLGSGASGSSSGSSGSTTTTTSSSGSTGGWHTYDPAAALAHHRQAQVPLPEASTGADGRRVASADPYSRADGSTIRNFGRPFRRG